MLPYHPRAIPVLLVLPVLPVKPALKKRIGSFEPMRVVGCCRKILFHLDFGEHEVVVARPDPFRAVFQHLARDRFRIALGHDVVDTSVGRLVRAVVALEGVRRVAELHAVVQFVVGIVPAVLDEVAYLRRILLRVEVAAQNLRERIGILGRFANHEFRLVHFRLIDLVVEMQIERDNSLYYLILPYSGQRPCNLKSYL